MAKPKLKAKARTKTETSKKIKGQIAIITRTKDRPIMLRRAIESILNQKYKNWVHIIVDAGNSTATKALVAKYASRYAGRVKIVPSAAAMIPAGNVGLANSESKFVVLHDDDDTWHPNFLSRCLAVHKAPPLGRPVRGVVCHSMHIEEKIMPDGTIKEVNRYGFNTWLRTIDIARLCASNVFPPISFLFERSLIDEVGHYNENLDGLDDWDFNIRATLAGEILVLQEPLANYHFRSVGPEDTIYTNSVRMREHYQFRSQLINQWIRKEYQEGRFSVAQAMSSCELNYETHRAAQRTNRHYDRLSTPV